MLPVSVEGLDGSLSIGGWYDPEDDTISLEDELGATVESAETPVRIELEATGVAWALGDPVVVLPHPLQVGDALSLDTGDIAVTLVVEDPEFEGDPGPVEHVRAGGDEACSLLSGTVYRASWGCARQANAGLPSSRIGWRIEDFKTDGYCVQLWQQSHSTGRWWRLDHSCGLIESGTAPRESFRRLRLIRTNIDAATTGLNPPAGRYMTIYER